MITVTTSPRRRHTRTRGSAHLYRVTTYYTFWPFWPYHEAGAPPGSRARRRTETLRTLEPVADRLDRADRYARARREAGKDWSTFIVVAEQLTDDGWQPLELEPRHVTGLLVDPVAGAALVPVLATGQGLRDLVGGFPERLTGGERDWACLVDEDAKMLADPPPPNPVATALARALGWPGARGDYLAGRALFLGSDGGEQASVPDRAVAALAAAGHHVAGYAPPGQEAGQPPGPAQPGQGDESAARPRAREAAPGHGSRAS